MTSDPIVDEVHRIRAKLLAECNGDLDELMDRFVEQESRDENLLVKSVEELEARRLPLAS